MFSKIKNIIFFNLEYRFDKYPISSSPIIIKNIFFFNLILNLLYIDKNKRVWAPATITLPNQGMVFVDGTSKKAWQWAAVKAVEITAEDRENNKHYPKEQTHRMDMKNIKYFGQKEFMDALEVIGFYAIK